ncbi:MAG: glycerate kinase [Opitutaceae bacterium]|nr:glycerate kinase [Opitutaceae bacterium]
MRVLICFDKFKDSMAAHEAGQIVKEVFEKKHSDWEIDSAALADGGEGFCEILTSSQGGKLEVHSVPGPILEPIDAQMGWVTGSNLSKETCQSWDLKPESKVAIIEMAQATGLQELPIDKRDCWKTTSLGTGELILNAVTQGAETILLGVGGSSTNDLGLGVLEALGLQFLDGEGNSLQPIRPELWDRVENIEGTLPDDLPPFKIACDVQNPLFGPEGAAAIYGPQKGLEKEDHARIEELGKKIARLLCDYLNQLWSLTKVPGSGAAGGITFGLSIACDVELLPGFDLVSQWLNISEKIENCDWLITGEGKFDPSSLQGKGPGTLAQTALQKGKRVTIMAGRIEVASDQLDSTGHLDLIEISPRELPLEEALKRGPNCLSNSSESLLKT